MRKWIGKLNQELLLETPSSLLVARGSAGLPWDEIKLQLDDGKIPSLVEGSFGYIYFNFDTRTEIAHVDHLCSFPIFYSNGYFSFEYGTLNEILGPADNLVVHSEIVLLGGQNISDETTNLKIKRLLPGTRMENGEIHQWFSIYNQKPLEKNPQTFIQTIERSVSKLAKSNFAFFLSGGCDSTALAAITRKLKMEVPFFHLYSKISPLSEIDLVGEIAREMDLKVHFFDAPISGDILPHLSKLQYSFWIENPFSAKYLCAQLVKKIGHAGIVTGEIGDQLFGGPKNPFILKSYYQYNLDYEHIAQLWIDQACSYGRHRSIEKSRKLRNLLKDSTYQQAYKNLNNDIVRFLRYMNDLSIEESLLRLNFLVKGPYRLFAYSQSDLDWQHPFAQLEVVNSALALETELKTGPFAQGKGLYLEAWKKYISKIPWQKAKFGLGIPAKSKFYEGTPL